VTAATVWVGIARLADVLAGAPADEADWLSASERERIATLRVPARRAQYLAGHWLARQLLARGFGDDAARWLLVECRSRPPTVDGLDALRVSISHSGDWGAAALAGVPIGVDLEQRPRTLDAAIAPLLLNAGEAADACDGDALLQRWVAKEAWIKREAGSALAHRLERLHLQAVARERADVCIDSHADFHVALAGARGCVVRRQGEVALVPGVAFAISER
jgi:4'-phosphopantetheinyl transferase